jgi:hypothetical protein
MSISVTLRPDDLDGYNRLIADLLACDNKNSFAGAHPPGRLEHETSSPPSPAPSQEGFSDEASA